MLPVDVSAPLTYNASSVCHLSLVSFHINDLVAPVPLFTSIPAFSVGLVVLVMSAFRVIIESPILRCCEFINVVVPVTVRLPAIVKSLVKETEVGILLKSCLSNGNPA